MDHLVGFRRPDRDTVGAGYNNLCLASTDAEGRGGLSASNHTDYFSNNLPGICFTRFLISAPLVSDTINKITGECLESWDGPGI